MCVCTGMCVRVHAYVRVCTCICVCVHMCMCVHVIGSGYSTEQFIYTQIYTHTHTRTHARMHTHRNMLALASAAKHFVTVASTGIPLQQEGFHWKPDNKGKKAHWLTGASDT